MEYDFSSMSDEELDKALASAQTPAPAAPQGDFDVSAMSDEELNAALASAGGEAPRMTREERVAQNQRAIERAQQPGDGEDGLDLAVLEGVKGAARAVKSIGGGIVGMVSGAARLAGTPVRLATGWEGLHRLADTIDLSYENFGRDALMSEYGENPDGWGYALGRAGEKIAGVAGSLAALGGVGKAVGAAGTALKAAGHAKTAAAVANTLPLMFGNDAAVRAYDTARANGKSKGESAALAGLNGAIHFLGFKAFENKALNKMLGMPAEMEGLMPKWAGEAAETGGQSFSSLARGVRNGMIKYTLAERGKGALKAGGIMGLQDMLSDPVMQVAEGASIDDIDFSRMLKAGASGLGEGALMEGALGAASVLKSPSEARKFIADKIFRGKDYKVRGSDGKMHDEPGLLNTSEGRMVLMKQNPDATERVLDIVEHGGMPRPAELDAAFLPPDMTAEELKKFASDWRNDLKPYVDEAWAADAPRQTAAPDAASAEPGRDMLSPEEAQSQQKTANDAAERQKVADRRAAADSMMLDFESWNRLYADGKTDLNFDEWRAAGKPGAIEANLTPKTEEAPTSETRANEEPAQPEQAEVVAPAAGAEARPVESAEAPAEAADARVVEPPAKPAEAASRTSYAKGDWTPPRPAFLEKGNEKRFSDGDKVVGWRRIYNPGITTPKTEDVNGMFMGMSPKGEALIRTEKGSLVRVDPRTLKTPEEFAEDAAKIKAQNRAIAKRMTEGGIPEEEIDRLLGMSPEDIAKANIKFEQPAKPVPDGKGRMKAKNPKSEEPPPAVWPKGWDNAGEEIKGYVVPNDGDVAPGREVAIAHRSGGTINAPQKIRGVVESVDGDTVKVYYRDGMGYDQHDTFKKSELVGVMPLTAVPTEGETSQTAENRTGATQEAAGARPAAETATTTPATAKPAEAPKTDASATAPAESGNAAPVVENRGDAATVGAPESVEAKIAEMKRGSPEQLKAQREYVEREVAKAKDAIKGKFRPKTGRLSPREKAVDAYERVKDTGDIPETVNIKVPGDGEITVKNNPNGMAFLDRFAAKFRPHPMSGESAMALPRSPSIKVSDKPMAESAEKEFAPFVSKDKTRERMLKPYTEGKMVVATDGRIAIRRPLRNGEVVKGADDAPRTAQVFGKAEDAATESAAIDAQAMFPKLQQALALEGSVFAEMYEPETGKPTGLIPRATSHAVELWRDADGALQVRSRDTDGNSYASDAWSGDSAPVAAFNGKALVEIVRLAAKNGEGKIEVRFAKDAQHSPVLFSFGGYEAVLMPLRAKGHFDEARRVDGESARANPAVSAESIPDGKGKMVKPKAAESDYGVTMFEEPAVDGEGVSYVVKDGPSDAHRMMFKSKAGAEAKLAELRAERKAIKESPSATLADGKKVRLLKTDEGWVPYDENYNDLRHGIFKATKTKAEAIKVAEKGVKWARDVAEENARFKAEAASRASDAKSNRLRRADGTDPLAEKNPAPKTVRKAVDKISIAISNRTGTGAITPEEADGIVRGIAESPETKHNRYRDFFNPLENDATWHESLGLDAESAKNIRDAFDRVKADSDLKKWFPQVDSAVKKAKDGKLSKKDAAPLFGKISEGLEKAERMGLSEAANRLREAAEVIRPVAEMVEQGDVNKFNYSTKGQKLNNRLGGTDKRGGKTVSLDTRNGTVDVRADGKGSTLDGNRHLIIDGVNGDELTVTMKDAAGKTLATRKMNRAQWSALAKGAVATDGDPAAPQKGDLIRMSRSDATDAPQSWTPEAKKPLERVAHALRNVVTVGGKRLKVEFLDERPADVDGNTRKSIGGVFTGTAADYEKPSLHHVGTGEGSQVYGWGLYGSTVRGVAEGYARQGRNLNVAAGDAEYKLDGKSLDRKNDVIDSALTYLASERMNTQKAIEEVNKAIDGFKKQLEDTNERLEWDKNNFRLQMDAESIPRRISHLDEVKGLLERDGGKIRQVLPSENVYEQTFFTDRAPGDESHLLKWYEPVSEEQAKWIERRLKAERISLKKFDPDELGTRPVRPDELRAMKAGDLYQLVSNALGSPKLASEFLARAGIDGVKYPVDSYGGKGVKNGDEVGWNYVSFRDDNIRVDHKWTDGELRYMRNSDGVTVGEYDAAKGEIRLYPGAKVADVVHEFTHPLVDFARAEASAGRGELLGKINQIIDAERATWEQSVREAYKDKSNETILEEIFTHAMGEKGADLFGKSTKTLQGRQWYNRLWEAIKGVWQDFATKMGWNKADLRGLERMSPEDAAQKILSEMAKGRNFGDAVTDGEGTRNAFAGRNGVSAEEDAAYMDAVKRGDMETAQRMVDEAAERSGYGKIGFHGTKYKHGQFTKFAKGSHVGSEIYQALSRIGVDVDSSMSKGQIKRIVEDLKANGKDILSLRVALKNPLRVSDFGESWHGLEFVRKLYAEHPDLFSPVEWDRLVKNPTLAHEMIEAKGYDGLVYDNSAEGILDYSGDTPGRYDAKGKYIPNDAYIPFHASQIKSADPVTYDDVGNVIPLSQRFNSKSNDIRYSRRVLPPPAPTTKDIADWLDGKDDVRRKWRRALQDKNIGIRDVEEKLGITDKNESAYYAKDRAFGKNEHELTVLQKQEVEPIVEKIHKSGGDLGLFSAYLYARHAGERNAVLKAEKGVDNGSGMNDAQAKTVFDAVDRLGLRAAFEDAAKDVWAMNRKYLQRRVDSGRMTQAEADFLMKRYQHYVPLRTDMTNEELDIFNSTTSGWKRNETMTAKGRENAADDPLAFSIVQNEQAIRASNANEVRRRWAGVVRRSKGELGEIVDGVNKGTAKWAFTFGDGETVETGSSMKLASERDDIILFKENGQLKAIKMKPGEHGRGLDLARAVTDKDVVQFNRHLDWIPRATRWMSAMRTQYVPTFIIRNLKADNLEVMLNALSERGLRGENGKSGGVAFFGKFLKNEVSVAKGVREYFKTGKSSDRYVQEAVENGLLTGGGMAAEGFTETARRLSDTLQALRERPKILGGTLKAAKDTISLLNACAEYNTRMGVYKTLREEGMSVADAVSYARDVTVNFNRKGYLTPYTNAAFMFSNAAVQGMGRAFKSIGSEHGKGVIAGLFMVGVAQALLDDWLGHDDEKAKSGGADSRNMTEYDKEHSLGVALPTGHRVKTGIRNPWALPMYAGRKTVELIKGITSGEQAMKDLANAVGNFVSEPVGGNGFGSKAEFLQTIAPTIIDPFVQWGTGKDYRGQDRLKKSFDKTAPQSWNGKERTPEPYKLLAQGLNALTGGNEFRKGWVDSAPEDWQLLTESVFGGVLTDLNNVVKAGGHAVDVARGKPAAQIARDIPFVRDTFTNLPENSNRYYAALDDYERDKAEFKKTTPERRREMKADKPYLFIGKSLLDGQIERVKEYMHLERGEVKVGQKWVEPKTPRTEEQKEKYRKLRLEMQARVLKRLGE